MRAGIRRRVLTGAALALLLAGFLGPGTRDARAWTTGYSGGNTMTAFNWDTFTFAYFPYSVDSTVVYTEVWDSTGHYTRAV